MNSGQFTSGSGAGGSGTVTSVSGTTNQIDVATGTSTPVISLDATALLAGVPWGGTTAGVAATQTLTVPNIPATPTAGTRVAFLSGFATAGATTLNVTPTGGSAWGAINLMKRVTTGVLALSAGGDMTVGGIYEALYDGTQWLLASSSATIYAAGALTSGSILRGNTNNQVQTSSGMNSSNGTQMTSYNSETTAAPGLPYLRGVTSQKSESAADTNVLTVTPAAAAGVYRINIVIDVSAATAATLGWTATWTDSNGNAQAPTNLDIDKAGVAAPALTIVATAGDTYTGSQVISVNSAGTAIVVKLTFTGTSFTAKISAILERLA